MSKTKQKLKNDKSAMKFQKAFLDELNLIFNLFNKSQDDVAKIMRVSRAQVHKYMTGANNLSVYLLKDLLEHFNLTLAMFFEKVERRMNNDKK